MKYPAYKITQWLDLSKKVGSDSAVIYGVMTKREKGGDWMHICSGKEPAHFAKQADAQMFMQAMKDIDNEKAKP
jgi:hypothetical protein